MVPNTTDTIIPLDHGAFTANDMICANDTAGALADCGISLPSSFTIGQVLYASSASAVAGLLDVAIGSVLASGGSATAPAYSKTPQLGASGTLGSLTLGNATSGLLTIQPVTGALGTVTLLLPAANDQVVARATTDTLTNKTLSSSTDVLGGVTMTLGSDATGDIYYRAAGALLLGSESAHREMC